MIFAEVRSSKEAALLRRGGAPRGRRKKPLLLQSRDFAAPVAQIKRSHFGSFSKRPIRPNPSKNRGIERPSSHRNNQMIAIHDVLRRQFLMRRHLTEIVEHLLETRVAR